MVDRSGLVGKLVAQLLLAANCTVTIAHSRTRDLPAGPTRRHPVPGGVGPMTIACLLRNTVFAACHARGIGRPVGL